MVSVDNSTDGSPRTATYQITTPGGTWDETDNGTYTIALNGNEVSDVNGNDAIAATLGNFTVNIDEDPPTGTNLLQNSGFENGLTNWNGFTGTEAITTDAFDGTQALELSSSRSGANQLISVTPGETYQLSGYARTTNNGWNGWGFRFRASDGTVLDTNQIRITAAEWTLFEFEGTAPANTARIEVFIWNGGDSGSTFLDSVSLEQVTDPGTDTTAPTASLTTDNVTVAGATTYDFTVTYSDNEAIATNTLDDTDIQVTGPNGFSQTATLVSVDNSSDGSPRTATYQITTPGGTWDDADNGTYTVDLNGNEVSDVNGNDAIAATLGTFTVNITGDPSTGDNLLQNPGFENGFANWARFTGTETITTTDPFTGTGALVLTASGSGARQLIDVTAGETYALSVNGKTDASGWTGFGFNFFDENGVKIEITSRRITTEDWSSYSIEDVVPANAVALGIWVFKGGDSGSTTVDDFVLERLGDDPTPPNTAPTITSNGGSDTANISTDENTTVVTNVEATDADGDTEGSGLTYSLQGIDVSQLTINPNTGELSFITAPDFEAPADSDGDNQYEVEVVVTDSEGATDTQVMTITVDDVDESTTNEPPTITSNGGGETATVNMDENTTAVTNVEATDADGDTEGNGLTYSLQGTDASQLTIDANTGELSFIAAPNFEVPTDSDGDNQYEVEVVVTDSEGATDIQSITITVDDTVESGVIFFDDFETSQGWVVNPSNSDTATTGQWEIANPEQTALNGVVQQLGTTVSGTQALVTDGTAGTSVGSFDVDNGLTSVRSPQIVLPETGDFIRLSFSYYLAHLDNANGDDVLRVTVVGAQTSRVVLLEQGNGTDRAAAWTDFSADISDFAGETITLLIETQDGDSPSLVEAAVDDVTVEVTTDAPPIPTSFRIEAEDFDTLQNYTPESGSFASGGELIRVNTSGMATTTFNGTSGRYNIVVGYYDENDGQSQLSIQLNNTTLDTWTLNNSPGGNFPNEDNLVERTVATNIFLSVGDSIELLGSRNSNEFARIDYVDFIAVG